MKKRRLPYQLIPYPAAVCAYIVFCFTGALYADVDNYNLAIICNGLLGNNNFCQYVHPLLCLILRLPKLLLPSADVFTAFAHLLLIVSLGWMLALLFERFVSLPERLAVLAAWGYLCFGVVLWNMNYTVWAAFFSFVGCLGIFSAKDGKAGRIRRIAGALLYGCGLMIRWEAAFLFLPYIALTAVMKMAQKHFSKESIKSELKRLLPWLIIFAGLGLGRNIFYSFEPWKTDLAYDNARRTLEDFPVLGWDEMPQIPEGTDEYTYRGVTGWINADTDEVDAKKLSILAEAGKTLRYSPDMEGISTALMYVGGAVLNEWGRLLLPLCVLLLLCFWPFETKPERVGKILALLGMFLIVLFFSMWGRAIIRVWQTLFLATFLPSVVLADGREKKDAGTKRTVALATALIFAAACFMIAEISPSASFVLSAADGKTEERFASFCGEDKIFLVGGWIDTGTVYNKKNNGEKLIGVKTYGWAGIVCELMKNGKLPSSFFLKHYIPVGWYWYGQEYYRSFLKELGVENPVKALFEQDRMRLWDRSEDSYFREYFFVYLYRLYGDMDVIKEKTVDGSPIYRFERKH